MKELIACKLCGKERQISDWQKGQPTYTGLCMQCSRHSKRGEKSYNWKGGKYIGGGGHIFVRIYPDDFFYSMARNGGYALEHRLVMAKHLGRCLQITELVHHKNGITNDNRIENLELFSNTEHIRNHNKGYSDGFRQGFIDGRSKRIQGLLIEIANLKNQIMKRQGVK